MRDRVTTEAFTLAQREHGGLDPRRGPPRRAVRARGAVPQAGRALRLVAVEPPFHATAGDAHRGGDMRLPPARMGAFDDQEPAVDGQAGVTV
jgi:hypothetical protein